MRHWFALLGAMLVVILRAPLRELLRDTWFYGRFDILPYKFGLASAFIITLSILVAFYVFLRWTDQRRRATDP